MSATVRAAGAATSAGSAEASVVPQPSDIQWWRRTWDGMDTVERLAFLIATWLVGQLLASTVQAATDPTMTYNPTAELVASGRAIYDNIIAALIAIIFVRRAS